MDADPRNQRIQELEAESERLRAENEQLRQSIKQLLERVEELERQNARQAAPFRRKDKDRKPPDQHGKPGRKKGHPPAYREEPPEVDDNIEVPLEACPRCGEAVTDVESCEQFIEETPPIRPHVTRLVTYTGTCPRCGDVRSTHPMQVSTATGAAKTHLGPRALALAAQLNKQFGLTTRTTCKVLKELVGLRLTPGGLVQAMHRVAERAKPEYGALWAGLREQPAVYADESSWWVGGPGWWLWVFVTLERILYRVEHSRGRDVVLETLGDHFSGVLSSDCLASYENLPYTMNKCYAHHLKDVCETRDRKPKDQQAFFEEVRLLLKSILLLGQLRTDLPPPEFAEKRAHLEKRVDELLGPPRTDPEEERIANRLRKRRHWLFTFIDHPEVEPTNNRAERALRPAVIARKLSCGNKTERGKRTWEILASITATCDLRGKNLAEHLRPLLVLPSPTSAR